MLHLDCSRSPSARAADAALLMWRAMTTCLLSGTPDTSLGSDSDSLVTTMVTVK